VDAIDALCLSSVLSVITAKVISGFHWNLMIWLGLPIGRRDERLVVIQSRILILDHFYTSLTIVEYGILGHLLGFLILTESPADFHDTQWNDWRRQDNESTTFWERSESILLRIRISNHFWLWLDALAEVYAFTSTEHGTSRGLSARAELLVTNLQCTGWQYCPLLRSPRVHVQQEMTMIVNILNAEVCRCRRGDLKTGHHLTVKTATETTR